MIEEKSFKIITYRFGFAIFLMLISELVLIPYLFMPLLALTGVFQAADENIRYFFTWVINDIFCYGLTGMIFYYLYYRRPDVTKNEHIEHACAKEFTFKQIFVYFFIPMLAGGSIATLISHAISILLGFGEIPNAFEGIGPQNPVQGVMTFAFIVIIAPIFEELIYRKMVIDPLKQYGTKFAVIVSAVLFGLIHGNFDQMPYAIIVGLFLALVYVKTDNIAVSIFLHFVNNLLVFLSSYAFGANVFGIANTDVIEVCGAIINIFSFIAIPLGIVMFLKGMHDKIYSVPKDSNYGKSILSFFNPIIILSILLFVIKFVF